MLRPFLVLLLGLATVSSTIPTTTTFWTKLDQTHELTCPMPDDGEKIQVCAWRFGDEGAFKSSFKKLHGDRISIEENNTDCMIRIERVEEEDQGIWGCKVHYQNKDGVSSVKEAERIIYVAKPEQTHELTCPMPDDGEKLQVCAWRNGDGAFKTSFKKSHGRITLSQTKRECRLHFYRVEDGEETWDCRLHYENSDGETILFTPKHMNNSTLDNKSLKHSSLDNSFMKGSSMNRLSTNNSTLDNKSLKHSSLDNSLMKGSSMNRFSTNNSTLDNNSLKHSSLDDSLMKGSSMDKLSTLDNNSQKHLSLDKSSMKSSSLDRLSTNKSTKNATEAATNCISENCNSVTVESNDWADWVSGILFFLVAGFLETYERITKNVPFEFAYSLALSPSAAAGVAKSGELGIAFGSNGDILFFGSRCFGVKTDVSLEFDIVVGAWTSISYILGQNYAIGLGVDNINFEFGAEESGGNFEILFNSERVIGGTVSLGRGVGYDLPINSEVNFEKCHTIELMRLDWRNFYSNMKK